jgi:phosphohistidine phosphatase
VRTLVLLRHGKSSYPDGVDDHDRPLSERGEREAPIAGRLIADALPAGAVIDEALISSATRAQQTWNLVRESVTARSVRTVPELYLATRSELLEIVNRQHDSDVVMIVGHNEGLEELAAWLTGTPVVLTTSTYARLTSARDWGEWTQSCAELVEVAAGR